MQGGKNPCVQSIALVKSVFYSYGPRVFLPDATNDSAMHALVVVIVLVPVSTGLLGCEENLTPRAHYDAVPFTIYGVLSPDLDTQSVRLYVPEDFPSLGSSEPLDVDVSSTDLHTGERRAWRDTVLVEPNGQHEYVFWEPFQVELGHVYRVEVVRRSDGVMSYADVRIPPPVTVRIDDIQPPLGRVDVYIEGEAIRALKPEAEYTVRSIHVLEVDTANTGLLRSTFSYEGREQRVEQGWVVTFDLVVDKEKMRFQYMFDNKCPVFILHNLELHVLVADATWDPPGGVFDLNTLSQPQTLSNVAGGFGFIGGGYRIERSLFPSREAVEAACFFYVW